MPITEPIDEDELEADLAALEQENLDEKMLKTGTIPQDQLQRLPQGVNGECEFPLLLLLVFWGCWIWHTVWEEADLGFVRYCANAWR